MFMFLKNISSEDDIGSPVPSQLRQGWMLPEHANIRRNMNQDLDSLDLLYQG